MNINLCWMSTPHPAQAQSQMAQRQKVSNSINTWMHRIEQFERDPSLLVNRLFSSPIDGVFVTTGALTYKDRMLSSKVYRYF